MLQIYEICRIASQKERSQYNDKRLRGLVGTPLVKNAPFPEEVVERDRQRFLLRRYGRPEEIAWAVIYLLSDASAWTTGSSMIIDGGGRVTSF